MACLAWIGTAYPPPASGYSAFVYSCGQLGPQGRTIRFVFGSETEWNTSPQAWRDAGTSTTPKTRATAAFEGWNEWRNRNATPITAISPDPQTNARQITVALVPSPGNDSDAFGYFNCTDNRIELNKSLLAGSPWFFTEVATHEMGHAISLMHTGDDDSLEPWTARPKPTMATCGTTGRPLTTDDVAAITYHYGLAADATLTANYGFENGTELFGASGVPPTSVTGSTSGGQYHARVAPNTSSDNIHQSVSHARGHHKFVRPSLQYTTPGATDGGIRLQLYSREVTYAANNTGCGWPISGRNMNSRVNGSFEYQWVLELTETLPTSSTWRVGTTSGKFWIPFVSDGNGNEIGATDLRLRLFSSASVSTGYVTVHYDDVRIQEVA